MVQTQKLTSDQLGCDAVSRILVAYLSVAYGRVPRKLLRKNAKQVKIEPFLYLRTLQTGSGESHPLLFPSCLKLQPHFAPLKPHGTGVVPYEKEKKN